MIRTALLLTLLTSALAAPATSPAPARTPVTVAVPREKVSLNCQDSYFRSSRENFLLADETYVRCTLNLPLTLRERWPGARTFFLIPRVTATLHALDSRGKGHWLPLAPLVNPGGDPLHRAVDARDYERVELSAALGRLGNRAGQDLTPDTVSTGGKLTVCAAPAPARGAPCATFDIAARFEVYRRNQER